MGPTDQAWQYFLENLDDIRSCVEEFTDSSDMAEFHEAVQEKNHEVLIKIMNAAWNGAPDDVEVYDTPGFREMSDLLDGSVPGFTD